MPKKLYQGSLKKYNGTEIHLNISRLDKGIYELKIVDDKKIVKNTQFVKK